MSRIKTIIATSNGIHTAWNTTLRLDKQGNIYWMGNLDEDNYIESDSIRYIETENSYGKRIRIYEGKFKHYPLQDWEMAEALAVWANIEYQRIERENPDLLTQLRIHYGFEHFDP